MFVGHYGPSFAIKSLRPAIPLWLLFIAVQLVDVAWALLVLLGVEKVRIVPGVTASNPLDLYYMPYTHSLVAAIFWSVAAAVVVGLLRRLATWFAALWIGVAVFSHWVLDFLVHRPDMPLYDDTMKVGLGLWNYPVIGGRSNWPTRLWDPDACDSGLRLLRPTASFANCGRTHCPGVIRRVRGRSPMAGTSA